jgi:hypothetical protein
MRGRSRLDESSMAYQRLPEVLALHASSIRGLHTLWPFGVAMAGAGSSIRSRIEPGMEALLHNFAGGGACSPAKDDYVSPITSKGVHRITYAYSLPPARHQAEATICSRSSSSLM